LKQPKGLIKKKSLDHGVSLFNGTCEIKRVFKNMP
jgi:hypothetical protein